MAKCTSCGADLPDYYTSCPNCGGQVLQNAAAPMPQQVPMQGGYAQPMPQQREITSVAGWLGWSLLCGFLPIIGSIIMLCTTKDETAKNFAKLMIILQAIGLIIGIVFSAILVPAMLGYVEKANTYGYIIPLLMR